MPKIRLSDITVNYDQQGSGEPLVLIPYLAADYACYAFQVAEYAKHFTCFSIDLPGTGESSQGNVSSIESFADTVAGFLNAMGIRQAHVSGMSLGAAVGMWLASRYPQMVKSLSLHSPWTRTDRFISTVVESWQTMAKALDNVPEMVVRGIFPWCFTPELYISKPDYIAALATFVRSRPAQSVDTFIQHSNAVIAHDANGLLDGIKAPAQITFGARDLLTSTRFADALRSGIRNSEVLIFEECSHAAIYERTEEFNTKTLAFLNRIGLTDATSA